jgi:Ca2+-binding EF-hand superfamily protein
LSKITVKPEKAKKLVKNSSRKMEVMDAEQRIQGIIDLFDKMDTKCAGFLLESNFEQYITPFMLQEAFTSKIVYSKEDISKRANHFFSSCDKDHSGVVSIQEFVEWSQESAYEEFLILIN